MLWTIFKWCSRNIAQFSKNGFGPMRADALSPTGGSMPHNNMQPYLGVNFIIALQGIYPSRG